MEEQHSVSHKEGSSVKKLTLVLLASSAFAAGEDSLKINQPVDHDLTAGSSQGYEIRLNAGDYAAGSIEQHGKVDIAVLLPDGSLLRRFPGDANDEKRLFGFIAETAGTYRLELTTAADQPAWYRIRLNETLSLSERLKPAPEQYASHRIGALRKQIASGHTDTEAFWKEVAATGTPLVEPVENDSKQQLVTFLWRAVTETRNVLVVGSFQVGGSSPLDYAMHRLVETDVWYLTVRLPAGARFAYALSPNDPLRVEGPDAELQRQATRHADPLNQHRWSCRPGASKYACLSMVELPGAVPQPWIVKNPAIPAGHVDKQKIKSELLKNERNLSVYTPPGYKTDGSPYALLVVFDEGSYLDAPVPTPVILDNLIAASKIPATVAVLIANPSQESRNKELPPNPDFADFLAKELVPWIHAHYNVTSDPRLTVVGGASYGGIAATFAGLRHPEVFGNVLSQSGSFWWAPDHTFDSGTATETGWLAKEFIKSPKLALKFYIEAGSFEFDSGGNGGNILEPSRHMRDVLLARGYEVHYQQFVGGHDFLSWRGTFADGLLALIGRAPASSR
jgi:enterochelin esterase-like enzyme